MKKILSLLLASAMALALSACAGTQPAADRPAADQPVAVQPAAPASAPVAETPDAPAQEKIDLLMWCIATESDAHRHAYETAIAEVTARYPQVNFTWEAIENQTYKTKIKAAVQADRMPDIFFTWSGAFLGGFVDAGRVYCLDDAYGNYRSELPESMMGNASYGGKRYAVPLTMNIVALYANMELLSQVGCDEIPATYEDLIACCDKLMEADIIPFGCSGKETWCVTEYLESYLEKSVGADRLNDIILGRASWDDPDVADAIDAFQGLLTGGYFDPDGIALSSDEVKANFKSGKYAFYMNGTWNCADFSADPEFRDKVKVAELPVINPERSRPGQLIGGPCDSLAVSASTPNPELAAEFCFELGKAICHYGYLDGCGLPAWEPFYDTSSLNPLSQRVSEICAEADAYVLFGDTAMNADSVSTYLSYVDMVYSCGIDGKGFTAGMAREIG